MAHKKALGFHYTTMISMSGRALCNQAWRVAMGDYLAVPEQVR